MADVIELAVLRSREQDQVETLCACFVSLEIWRQHAMIDEVIFLAMLSGMLEQLLQLLKTCDWTIIEYLESLR